MGGQPFTQHTDKFVIDDDDMDSNTATESEISLRSMSFLHRVNDRLRKMLDQSSKDAMQDTDKHSLIWGVPTLEAAAFMDFHGKRILRKFTLHQKYWKQSHNETSV